MAVRRSYIWRDEDDILALWLYDVFLRSGKSIAPNNLDIIAAAHIIGVTPASVVMKLGNCAALNPQDAKKGLVGKSQQSQRIFTTYFSNKNALKAKAEEIIESAPPQFFLEKARLKKFLHS